MTEKQIALKAAHTQYLTEIVKRLELMGEGASPQSLALADSEASYKIVAAYVNRVGFWSLVWSLRRRK